ncbi:hypothetical protein BDZ89DRAFT_1041597 [Hymenopellis radicata]|nr:hypothetical protein BDZ89DRAFT_1041597 [Hymenopellis radicata]
MFEAAIGEYAMSCFTLEDQQKRALPGTLMLSTLPWNTDPTNSQGTTDVPIMSARPAGEDASQADAPTGKRKRAPRGSQALNAEVVRNQLIEQSMKTQMRRMQCRLPLGDVMNVMNMRIDPRLLEPTSGSNDSSLGPTCAGPNQPELLSQLPVNPIPPPPRCAYHRFYNHLRPHLFRRVYRGW